MRLAAGLQSSQKKKKKTRQRVLRREVLFKARVRLRLKRKVVVRCNKQIIQVKLIRDINRHWRLKMCKYLVLCNIRIAQVRRTLAMTSLMRLDKYLAVELAAMQNRQLA